MHTALNRQVKYITFRGSLTQTHRKNLIGLVEQDEWWNTRADNAVASIVCVDREGNVVAFGMLEGKHEGPDKFWERIAGPDTVEIGSIVVAESHRRLGIAGVMIHVLYDIAMSKNLRPVIACYEENLASKKMIEGEGIFSFIGTFNEIGPTFHAYAA